MAIKGSKKVAIGDFQRATEEYLAQCKTNKRVPFLVDFALMLDISMDTIERYQHFAEYAACIKKIKQSTESGLLNKALNENKPIMPIFLLKSKFGYVEQSKIDLTSNGETLGVIALPQRKG